MFNQTPLNLAEAVRPKLESLTDAFSVAMYTHQIDKFDFQDGRCRCDACRLEGRISSIHGILELAANGAQLESWVA